MDRRGTGDSGSNAVISANIARTAEGAAAAMEKRMAHLREQAKEIARRLMAESGKATVLEAVFALENAERIYREETASEREAGYFGEVNSAQESAFREMLRRFDTLYRCRTIAETSPKPKRTDIYAALFGSCGTKPEEPDQKIAFLRNVHASRAFERFAKYLGGVSAVYESNFQSACEAVVGGRATYALLPIANTSDGRLGGFYRLLEKYELSVLMSCLVESDDGENATVFALVYKDRLYLPTKGELLCECRITFENPSELSALLDAARYFGVRVDSADAIPRALSGRENTYGLIFGLPESADTAGFLCYLALEYPQAASLGLYDRMEEPS